MMPRWQLEWPQVSIIVLLFGLAAVVWPTTPPRIPEYFLHPAMSIDFSAPSLDITLPNPTTPPGMKSVDKFPALFVLPLAAAALEIMLLLIPAIDPGRANYRQFERAYWMLRLAFIGYIAALYVVSVLVLRGYQVNRTVAGNLAQGALFIVTGNLLGKVRPNWFVGIHNPWTLSSKVAWDRTHRLGGWLFIGLGIIVAVDVVLPIPIGTALSVLTAAVLIGALTIYSYFIWRADPEKIPPAGTQPE
jgi:uncharacterized membrane protein